MNPYIFHQTFSVMSIEIRSLNAINKELNDKSLNEDSRDKNKNVNRNVICLLSTLLSRKVLKLQNIFRSSLVDVGHSVNIIVENLSNNFVVNL